MSRKLKIRSLRFEGVSKVLTSNNFFNSELNQS